MKCIRSTLRSPGSSEPNASRSALPNSVAYFPWSSSRVRSAVGAAGSQSDASGSGSGPRRASRRALSARRSAPARSQFSSEPRPA